MHSGPLSRKTILAIYFLFAMLLSANAHGQEKAAPQKQDRSQTGTISGTVVTDNDYPLAGAVVYVRPVNSITLGRTVVTDAEGKFAARGLDNTLYRISASAPAYIMPESVAGDSLTYYRVGDSVRLQLIQGGVITGKVTNAAGVPVTGIRVRALPVIGSRASQLAYSTPPTAERLTDDRGIYRIYGLSPGTYVVSAGGPGMQSSALNAYDAQAPTFAPSSTIDTASEIIVRAGQESNVEIRYRIDHGRSISGIVRGSGKMGATVSLRPVLNNRSLAVSNAYLNPDTNGFTFYGVLDGEYELLAHSTIGTVEAANSDITISETRRITVKGNDVTGVELTLLSMGSISGKITLESSNTPECRAKSRPRMSETVVDLIPDRNRTPVQEFPLRHLQMYPALPDDRGMFVFRNVRPGQYIVRPQFFAQYWYLQSISRGPAVRAWTNIRAGERIADLNISLAEGAASLRGQVLPREGTKPVENVMVYLVPSDDEKREDVLRFFAAETGSDGAFSINSIAPGKYWVLALPAADPELTSINVSSPALSESRKELRHAAASANFPVELKACREIDNIRVPLSLRQP